MADSAKAEADNATRMLKVSCFFSQEKSAHLFCFGAIFWKLHLKPSVERLTFIVRGRNVGLEGGWGSVMGRFAGVVLIVGLTVGQRTVVQPAPLLLPAPTPVFVRPGRERGPPRAVDAAGAARAAPPASRRTLWIDNGGRISLLS